MNALRTLGNERGFTMIEMQICTVIVGILSSLAGPSFMGFADAAARVAATANVRGAETSVEAYYLDNGTYFGMDVGSGGADGLGLRGYDPAVEIAVDPAQGTSSSYCIYTTVGDFTFYKLGPLGSITEDPTPAGSPCA
jgi:prepilin-type N-terminal cleavage/methylation domain-containing protein